MDFFFVKAGKPLIIKIHHKWGQDYFFELFAGYKDILAGIFPFIF